ncbi:MAG: bifunctional phosphoribosylaminoimidazolecarboxamide formyltransferase/IMP cyclohydrolase, partial [Mycetocola sp.]
MSGPSSHDPSLYRERDVVPVKRALISVSDKSGLVELGTTLAGAGVELVSTGSTASTLRDAGLTVTEVSSVTGFPESLDGRVKTLHPAVHAGILADLRLEDHEKQLADLGIAPFEVVVVNLYPFTQTVQSGADAADVIENIDIGGPTLVRAAAKNHANVAIVVNPDSYAELAAAVVDGGTTLATRQKFASLAFEHTAGYDMNVALWFAENLYDPWQDADDDLDELEDELDEDASDSEWGEGIILDAELQTVLRYGENSHQAAA